MKNTYKKVLVGAIALLLISSIGFETAYGYGRSSRRRSTSNVSGRVLGASTSNLRFETNLGFGSRGEAVVALQERLRAEGFFTFPTSTGFFGPITRSALAAFQASKGIVPAAGFLGPLTRAFLNQ